MDLANSNAGSAGTGCRHCLQAGRGPMLGVSVQSNVDVCDECSSWSIELFWVPAGDFSFSSLARHCLGRENMMKLEKMVMVESCSCFLHKHAAGNISLPLKGD